MVRLCGAALGLFAFAVTILLGLTAGNPADVTLLRAVWAMVVFCLIGLCVGWVAWRVLDEHALGKRREMFLARDGQEPAPGPEGSDTRPQSEASSAAEG